MSTYTTSAGCKRELPARPSTEQLIQDNAERYGISRAEAIDWLGEVNWEHFQDETPMTHDLSDLSAHEPSIRTGESVSGLDEWISCAVEMPPINTACSVWVVADSDGREFHSYAELSSEGWETLHAGSEYMRADSLFADFGLTVTHWRIDNQTPPHPNA